MMRVESYIIAHYGREYLEYAIRGIYDNVQRIHVVYTPHPSHGTGTDIPCPDTRQDMLDAAFAHDPGRKINWVDAHQFYQEGQHRDYALSLCMGADLALVVDCDEIWEPATLERALRQAYDSKARVWRLNFVTPWRSFNWACRDDLWPDRIHNFHGTNGYGYVDKNHGEIFHLGYAVRDAIMRYKWLVHGHVGELRPGWWEKWEAWPPVDDLHPANDHFWHPEPFDRERLPGYMRTHPYWGLDRID